MSLNGVEDLHAALEAQRVACEEVLKRKDALADDFRRALKEKDNRYVEEQRSQASDVQTMLDTMALQAKSISQDHQRQLEDLEGAFLEERTELLDLTKGRWTE